MQPFVRKLRAWVSLRRRELGFPPAPWEPANSRRGQRSDASQAQQQQQQRGSQAASRGGLPKDGGAAGVSAIASGGLAGLVSGAGAGAGASSGRGSAEGVSKGGVAGGATSSVPKGAAKAAMLVLEREGVEAGGRGAAGQAMMHERSALRQLEPPNLCMSASFRCVGACALWFSQGVLGAQLWTNHVPSSQSWFGCSMSELLGLNSYYTMHHTTASILRE